VWEYPSRKLKVQWASGHTDNIFCTQFMPNTDDKTVISCARDTQVRVHAMYGGKSRGWLMHSVLYRGVPCVCCGGCESHGIRHSTPAEGRCTRVYTCNGAEVKKFGQDGEDPNCFLSCAGDGTVLKGAWAVTEGVLESFIICRHVFDHDKPLIGPPHVWRVLIGAELHYDAGRGYIVQ
jgi:hypothetical protein